MEKTASMALIGASEDIRRIIKYIPSSLLKVISVKTESPQRFLKALGLPRNIIGKRVKFTLIDDLDAGKTYPIDTRITDQQITIEDKYLRLHLAKKLIEAERLFPKYLQRCLPVDVDDSARENGWEAWIDLDDYCDESDDQSLAKTGTVSSNTKRSSNVLTLFAVLNIKELQII